MPYYKRQPYTYRGRKQYRYVKARRPKWGRYDIWAGKKALKMAGKALSMINVEYKRHDVTISESVNTTGVIGTLNTISQGDTDGTRDGDSLKMINLTWKGYVTGTVNSILRLIIFLDKQDSITTVSDYLSSVYITTNQAVNAPKDHDKRFESKTLYDHKFGISGTGREVFPINKVIPINKHSQYSSGTSNINTGALKYILISSTTSNNPVMTAIARLSYTDN